MPLQRQGVAQRAQVFLPVHIVLTGRLVVDACHPRSLQHCVKLACPLSLPSSPIPLCTPHLQDVSTHAVVFRETMAMQAVGAWDFGRFGPRSMGTGATKAPVRLPSCLTRIFVLSCRGHLLFFPAFALSSFVILRL